MFQRAAEGAGFAVRQMEACLLIAAQQGKVGHFVLKGLAFGFSRLVGRLKRGEAGAQGGFLFRHGFLPSVRRGERLPRFDEGKERLSRVFKDGLAGARPHQAGAPLRLAVPFQRRTESGLPFFQCLCQPGEAGFGAGAPIYGGGVIARAGLAAKFGVLERQPFVPPGAGSVPAKARNGPAVP